MDISEAKPIALPAKIENHDLGRGERPKIRISSEHLDAWLGGKSIHTVRAYLADLDAFRAWSAAIDPLLELDRDEWLERFFALGPTRANLLLLKYRNDCISVCLASATIHRRLAAIVSLGKLFRRLGMIDWTLEVEPVRVERIKDCRGPDDEQFVRIVEAIRRLYSGSVYDRNICIILMLRTMALRRSEVAGISFEDLSDDLTEVKILGKGKKSKVALTIPSNVQAALRAWVDRRGDWAGPLFFRLDASGFVGVSQTPLSAGRIFEIVREIGREAGIPDLRPHGLRHSGITAALDRSGGDLRSVQKYSRHCDIKTLLVYDDSRRDEFGRIAQLVDEEHTNE